MLGPGMLVGLLMLEVLMLLGLDAGLLMLLGLDARDIDVART